MNFSNSLSHPFVVQKQTFSEWPNICCFLNECQQPYRDNGGITAGSGSIYIKIEYLTEQLCNTDLLMAKYQCRTEAVWRFS